MEKVVGYWAIKVEDGTKAILNVLVNGQVRVRPERVFGWSGDLKISYDSAAKQYCLECPALPTVYQVWTVVDGVAAGPGDDRTRVQIEHSDESKELEMRGFGIRKKLVQPPPGVAAAAASASSAGRSLLGPTKAATSLSRSASASTTGITAAASKSKKSGRESTPPALLSSRSDVVSGGATSLAMKRSTSDDGASDALLNGRWKVTFSSDSTCTMTLSITNGKSGKVVSSSGKAAKIWPKKSSFKIEYDSGAESYAFEGPNETFAVFTLRSPVSATVELSDDSKDLSLEDGSANKEESLSISATKPLTRKTDTVLSPSSSLSSISGTRRKSGSSSSSKKLQRRSQASPSTSPGGRSSKKPKLGSISGTSMSTKSKSSTKITSLSSRKSSERASKKSLTPRQSTTKKKRSKLKGVGKSTTGSSTSLASSSSSSLLTSDDGYKVPRALGPSDIDMDFGDWTLPEWINDNIDGKFFEGLEERFHQHYRKDRDIKHIYENPQFDKKLGPTDIGRAEDFRRPEWSIDVMGTVIEKGTGSRRSSGQSKRRTSLKKRGSAKSSLDLMRSSGASGSSRTTRKSFAYGSSSKPSTPLVDASGAVLGPLAGIADGRSTDDSLSDLKKKNTDPITRIAGVWKVDFDGDISAQYTIHSDGSVVVKPKLFHGFSGKIKVSFDRGAKQYALECDGNENVYDTLTLVTEDEMSVEYNNDESGEECEGSATRFHLTSVKIESRDRSKDGRFQLGDHIYLTKDRSGFVRYIGPTHVGSGEMFGIEFDMDEDQTCIDHSWTPDFNGILDGKEYFTCPKGKGTLIEMREVLEDQTLRPADEVKREEIELERKLTQKTESTIVVKAGLKDMLGRWRVILTDGTKAVYSILPSGHVQTHPPNLHGWIDPQMDWNSENGTYSIECEQTESVFEIISPIGGSAASGKCKIDHRAPKRAMGAMVKLTKEVVDGLKAKVG